MTRIRLIHWNAVEAKERIKGLREAGYQVDYEYCGQRYSTRLPYDPGERLRVQVAVRPA